MGTGQGAGTRGEVRGDGGTAGWEPMPRESQDGPRPQQGFPQLLAALGHTRRRGAVAGHTLNRETLRKGKSSHNVCRKWTILPRAAPRATRGGPLRGQPRGETPVHQGAVQWRRGPRSGGGGVSAWSGRRGGPGRPDTRAWRGVPPPDSGTAPEAFPGLLPPPPPEEASCRATASPTRSDRRAPCGRLGRFLPPPGAGVPAQRAEGAARLWGPAAFPG